MVLIAHDQRVEDFPKELQLFPSHWIALNQMLVVILKFIQLSSFKRHS